MAGGQVVNAEQTFLDVNGDPLSGGSVFFYAPGTTDPANTWVDQGLTVANTNPVMLDQAGRALIWGQGLYRQIVLDQFGNLQWDRVTEAAVSTLSIGTIDGTFTVNGNTFLNGNLSVTGNTTLNGLTNNGFFIQNGNETVNGSLAVSGATQLSTLNVSGASTLGGGAAVTGPVNFIDAGSGTNIFSTNLGVPQFNAIPGQLDGLIVNTGNTDLRGGLTVEGQTTVGGPLNVNGTTTINESPGATGALILNGSLNVTSSPGQFDAIFATGNIQCSGAGFAQAWNVTSDSRLKTDIVPFDRGLAAIKDLRPISYRMRDTGHRYHGLMADDLVGIIPEAVSEYQGVKVLDPMAVIATLINTMRELDEKVDRLERGLREVDQRLVNSQARRGRTTEK